MVVLTDFALKKDEKYYPQSVFKYSDDSSESDVDKVKQSLFKQGPLCIQKAFYSNKFKSILTQSREEGRGIFLETVFPILYNAIIFLVS